MYIVGNVGNNALETLLTTLNNQSVKGSAKGSAKSVTLCIQIACFHSILEFKERFSFSLIGTEHY